MTDAVSTGVSRQKTLAGRLAAGGSWLAGGLLAGGWLAAGTISATAGARREQQRDYRDCRDCRDCRDGRDCRDYWGCTPPLAGFGRAQQKAGGRSRDRFDPTLPGAPRALLQGWRGLLQGPDRTLQQHCWGTAGALLGHCWGTARALAMHC